MKKVVTTEMNEHSVIISMLCYDSNNALVDGTCVLEIPFKFVNPRTAIQAATLFVQDPTVPSDEKEAKS